MTAQSKGTDGLEVPVATAKDEALKVLKSVDSFVHLRRALGDAGLPGEEGLGVGVFYVAESRFQPYPLRLQIEERTEGTANYIVEKVSQLLLPGSVIKIDPTQDSDWDRLAKSPNRKVVFIPEWGRKTANGGHAWLDVQQNKLIRAVGVKKEGRVSNTFSEIEGNFACIAADRFPEWRARPRWLTMRQPERPSTVPKYKRSLSDGAIAMWQEIERVFRQRAELPLRFPEWQQILIEAMCERDEKAAVQIPTLLQCWRTMCVLRPYRSTKEEEWLQPNFADFAATTMLCRPLFREGQWFPSPKAVIDKIGQVGIRDGAVSPLTGKGRWYERLPEKLSRVLLEEWIERLAEKQD
jgi:hypothetical protein